jgi:hypothetical protein
MALTAEQEQELILRETGARSSVLTDTQKDEIADSLVLWWERHSGQNGMQATYARRDVLRYLQGVLIDYVDRTTAGDNIKANQVFGNVTKMLESVEKDIANYESPTSVTGNGRSAVKSTHMGRGW